MTWLDRLFGERSLLRSKATSENPPDLIGLSAAFSGGAFDCDNPVVRVFVSSTFLDMQRERDVLVRQTFPALRTKFRARGVGLFEVDLRWGITQEQSESGKTLPTLLAEIDRCRPYFIGLLGDRYGWVPPASDITDELRASYPSIARATECSVTELEIIHGVLRDPETAKRAILFERDPTWLATQAAEERAVFVADSDEARAKLADLKARIRASGAKIIPYAKPDDIGPVVERALIERIETQFPEAEAPEPFTQTARLHAAYARDRRGHHIGAAPYMAALDAWIAQSDAKPMLVTGASGGGKSTLVANWLAHHRACAPNDTVFEHYLGASPDSADPILLIRRLWEHLNRAIGEKVDQPSDERTLIEGLPQRLAQAHSFAEQSGGNVLIVLDGLDKLSSQQDLRWLPTYLPPRVRLLASSLDGDARVAAEARGWVTLEVKPLTQAQRREFIGSSLKVWGRALSPARTERVLASPLSASPLFLKTLLDELRVVGIESQLNARLDDYLASQDIPDLFGRVLHRLEGDCGAEFVRSALSLIWASRAGLEESEIIAITDATPLNWAIMRNGLGDALRDQASRIAFSHDFLRKAVEECYLLTDERKRAAHLTIADHFDEHGSDERQAEELPFQLREAEAWERLEALLVDLDRFKLLRARGDSELLSNWLQLKERGRDPEELLCSALNERAGDAASWHIDDLNLAFLLSAALHFFGVRGAASQHLGEMRTAACRRLLGAEHRDTLASMSNLAQTLKDRGDLPAAQRIEEDVLATSARVLGAEHPETLTSSNNLALILLDQGDLAGAQKLQETTLAARTRVLGPTHERTLEAMGNLASIFFARGDFRRALELQERVLEGFARLNGSDHPSTLTSMAWVAQSQMARGDIRAASALQQRALEGASRQFGLEHPATLTHMSQLGRMYSAGGDFRRAQELHAHVAEVRTRTLGTRHPDTITSLALIADCLSDVGDHERARDIQQQVLDARRDLLGQEHPDTLSALNSLALSQYALGEYELAQSLQELLLETQSRTLGPEHPNTLGTINNLAGTLSARGDLEGAQRLFERLLEARIRTMGYEHPRTLRVMNNLVTVLSTRGDLDRAEELQTRALEIQTRLMGKDHPDTRTLAHNLASIRAARERRSD
jgi:tetratricopeptide (TPR) repeat protein